MLLATYIVAIYQDAQNVDDKLVMGGGSFQLQIGEKIGQLKYWTSLQKIFQWLCLNTT